MINDSIKNIIILSITPHFGISRFIKAKENNIDLNDLVNSPYKYIKLLSIRQESIDFLIQKKYLKYFNKVNEWLDSSDKNQIVTYLDDRYPVNLKHINNPPLVLYCKGNIEIISNIQIAIVGARNNTSYGKNVTAKLCAELKGSNITITSGLAYGIDTLAHKYALENKLNTIAVLGTGVDIIYPSSNKELYNKIINNNGLVISELPLETQASRYTFPQRNRIISGLSQGVVIVEATDKSGSLITAQHALEQNKEVFAVPGSIFSNSSKGCHNLIKQGAKLICNVNDILEEIKVSNSQDLQINTNKIEKEDIKLNELEKVVFDTINQDITTIDQIITKSNLPYQQVTSILFELEIKSLIEAVPGGYIKI
ncbi:MAG: DNA-processing protein DprA [Francisella sp.]